MASLSSVDTTHVRFLVVGAGMTGLAFANFVDSDDFLILEAGEEVGGWCKTIQQDGFVWDFSGHFFHFRNPEIESYLVERMPPDEVVVVTKDSRIYHRGNVVDFPFQKNIHQLPKDEFIECLHDLVFRPEGDFQTFKEMLVHKFGNAIADKFLIPYNTKLYACDLDELDADAMGRFFPHASLTDIVGNMKDSNNASYNATFTYPRGGAIMYVKALEKGLPASKIALNEQLVGVDLRNKIAKTSCGRSIEFEFLVSSAPFDRFVNLCQPALPVDEGVLTCNKVLVFNLGFDTKGPADIHWMYFPDLDVRFYRVGFYDNIIVTDRMSLYVEIGLSTDDPVDVEDELQRVLRDLKKVGIIVDHQLVSWHTVTMDPAYVHINSRSKEAVQLARETLASRGVFTVGRYGGWTYCSIEDNILEAKLLAEQLSLFA